MTNDLEGYPKICIRCKQSYDHIELMTLYQTYGFNHHETKFPACEVCKKKFLSYTKLNKLAKKSKFILLVLFVMTFMPIFLNIYWGIMSPPNIIVLLTIVFFYILIAVIVMIPKFIAIMHPGKLSKYIKIKKDGTVEYKDPDFNKEMAKLSIQQVAEEVYDEIYGIEEQNKLFCPKCGKEYRIGIPFCDTCGKDLRVIIN